MSGVFDADESTLTAFAGLSPVQVENYIYHGQPSPLTGFVDPMFAVDVEKDEVVVVLAPECVGFLESAGWSKGQVKEQLFELTQRKVSAWIRAGVLLEGGPEDVDSLQGVPKSPDSVTLLAAGGAAGVLVAVVPIWGGGVGSQSVTKLIRPSA